MIRFILLQNRQGKTRLAKYYVPLEESEKHKVEYEVHRLVVNRDPKFTNFVEPSKSSTDYESQCYQTDQSATMNPSAIKLTNQSATMTSTNCNPSTYSSCTWIKNCNCNTRRRRRLSSLSPLSPYLSKQQFRTHKVIYRRYAGLFFSLCVDITDNELAYLECIHLFVEILDHFFSNVCELDLVFNFHKVYLILDEFILAGELQETSKKAIIERLGELEKLE